MPSSRQPSSRRSKSKSGKSNVYVTRSGKQIKVNRSLGDRWKAKKDLKVRQKAEYLSTLPAERWERLLYRLHPKRLIRYWFSRQGAVMALKITGIGIVACFLLLIGLFAYYRKDLPNIKDISNNGFGGTTTYYDRTGKIVLWQDYNSVKRVPVQTNQQDSNIRNATVAIEDHNFYHEGAFDVRSLFRAGYHDLFNSGSGIQGASTITEQLVKLNENWVGSRTISVKIKEVILAVELERSYSKDDILTGYLNIAPYGGIEYGAEAASEDYFHTSAAKLTLPQATMLAAIPQAPDIYSPYSPDFDKTRLLDRQHYILDQMVKYGDISQSDATAAENVDVLSELQPLQSKYDNVQAPYFVLAAKNELEAKYGTQTIQRGGWKVITTLNMPLQQLAEKEVANNFNNVKRNGGDEEAIAAEDVKTGQMMALVGGVDFNNPSYGQINYAETLIPPGSSFKPYDYASLIDGTTNAGAGSILYDVQQPLPGYNCTNKTLPPPKGQGNCLEDYDFKYPGPETLRYALAGSRNVPAVKAMLTVGTDKVIANADAMMSAPNAYNCYSDTALTKTTQCYGASAIGDGAYLHLDQHVNGLATLARLGQAIPNTYIMNITDANDKPIYQWSQPTPKQVIRQDSAYIVDSMLSDPNASYLPVGYKFQHYKGWNFGVKTGTTNDNYDGLMTSWSTQYAVASWVGYHTRNKALTAGAMEYLTEPLTKGWMESATDMLNMKPVNWTQPSDIKTLPAYVVRNHIGVGSVEPSPTTDVFPSWYVAPGRSNTATTIDKVSGNLATNCTPNLAKSTLSNSNVSAFSADIFYPPGSSSSNTNVGSTTTSSDNVHNCGDSGPTVSIQPSNSNGSNNCNSSSGCTFQVTVTQGTHPFNDSNRSQFPGTINLIVNGQTVTSSTVSDSNCSGSPQVCTISINYTPANNLAGQSIGVSAQAIDSVLYDSTSQPVQISVTNSAGNGGNPPNQNNQ